MSPKTGTVHPLPPCPGTPNCFRDQAAFQVDAPVLLSYLADIFDEQAHHWQQQDTSRIELHAVYRIPVFAFKDDVDVIIEEDSGGKEKSILYIRSASRIGKYDLGVNKRRVKNIIKKLKKKTEG